jgi:integrase
MAKRGDGCLYYRGETIWCAYYHNGKQLRESTRLRRGDEVKAQRLLDAKTKAANTADFIEPDRRRVTFDELAAAYLTDYKVNGRRSLRDAERITKNLLAVFGGERALNITTDRVATYKTGLLDAGAAKATVNRQLAAIRRMFRLAIKAKKVRVGDGPYIEMLDESDNVREGFVEPADFDQILANLDDTNVRDVARFGYLSAWRRGEVLSLQWRDVTLTADGGSLLLRRANSKTKKGRTLPLRGELLDLIRDRAKLRRLDCPYVFHRNGKPIRDFRSAWWNAAAAAGHEGLKFHDLRRSAVRNMVRAGVSQRVARQISGHKTASVFDRYDIVDEADLAAAIERTATYVERRREDAPKVVPISRPA